MVFQGHMLWFSILETFSCLTYVLYVNLFLLKSFFFDDDLLNALKASVLLPCSFFFPLDPQGSQDLS